MDTLRVPERDQQLYDAGYSCQNGKIDVNSLFAESEEIIYKCMCFEIEDNSIFWHRLILTDQKLVDLWKKRVFVKYLRNVETLALHCIDHSNAVDLVPNYDREKILHCLDRGDTPFYLCVDKDHYLLNSEDTAMTLFHEINALICG